MFSKVRSRKTEEGSSEIKKMLFHSKKIIFILFFFFYSLTSNAQCAMCRAALESEGNETKNEALNDGIVYLMAIPYVLVGVIGFVVYRMFRKKKLEKQ
jgi:phosphatidylglycerophosphatase A